jgi:hypothetical protein
MFISQLKIALLILAIVLFQNVNVLAQNGVPVELVDDCKDSLGKKFFNEIKDRVSKSSAMRTAKPNDQKILKIIIGTLDPVSNVPQYSGKITVASVIWVGQVKEGRELLPYYMTYTMATAGIQNIERTADAILEQTYKLIGRKK